MVTATMLWGATFIMVRDAVHGLAPLSLVTIRYVLATLAWGAVLLVRRAFGVRASGTREALLGGLASVPFTAGGYIFQTIGLTATSAGSSAFLTSTGTLITAFIAWPLLGQRPGRRLLLGIALAAVGSGLLGRGEAWTLLGAVVYAFQIVIVGAWMARGADAWILVAVQTVGIAAILLPFTIHRLPVDLAGLDQATWWRMGYLVLAGALIAPLLQVIAQRSLPPGRIALLFALETVWAGLFGYWLDGDRLGWAGWSGCAFILTGIVVAEPAAAGTLRRLVVRPQT